MVVYMFIFIFLIVGKEFQGRRLKVSMARRKPMMGGMRGGMPMRDGMMGRGGKCQLYLLVFDYSREYLCHSSHRQRVL